MQAQRYANLRKPYLINDMQLQDLLLDRRAVYATLEVHLSPTAWSCHSILLQVMLTASHTGLC